LRAPAPKSESSSWLEAGEVAVVAPVATETGRRRPAVVSLSDWYGDDTCLAFGFESRRTLSEPCRAVVGSATPLEPTVSPDGADAFATEELVEKPADLALLSPPRLSTADSPPSIAGTGSGVGVVGEDENRGKKDVEIPAGAGSLGIEAAPEGEAKDEYIVGCPC
jgi:hypothetical protein